MWNTIDTLLVCVMILTACGNKDIAVVKELIEAELSDPSSAQYRDVVAFSEGVVCGEVNSKTQLGGYVGFQRFLYVDRQHINLKRYPFALAVYCNNNLKKQLAFATARRDDAAQSVWSAKFRFEKAKKEADLWTGKCKEQKTDSDRFVFCAHAEKYVKPMEEAAGELASAEAALQIREVDVKSLQ